MAYNGSGVFARLYNFVTDRNNGVKIRADRMDAELDGIATGLSNAITKDGQTTITANIPFNDKRITGLGDATSGTDALNRNTADARYLELDGTGTMTGPIIAAAGTVGAPGIAFASDTNSGIYRIGADNIGVAVNGAKVVDVATTGATVTGALAATGAVSGTTGTFSGAVSGAAGTFSGVVTAPAGAVGAPGFTFSGDTDSGFYRIGANNIGAAVNGAKVLDVATSGLGVTGTLSATGAVSGTTGTFTGAITMQSRAVDAFPAGTKMLFRQTSAPTGWTKDTTFNDAALRVVSGTVSQQTTSGNEFTTLFASRTIATENLPAHTHTFSGTTSANGAHGHTMSGPAAGETNDASGSPDIFMRRSTQNNGTYTDSNDIQFAADHTHTYSGTTSSIGSGTAMNFDVNFVDVIIATKD